MTQSKELSIGEVLQAKEFSDFLHAARDYCIFIETENSLTGIGFLRSVKTHLVQLYFLGLQLPSVYVQTEKDFESNIDNSSMKTVLRFIADRLLFSYYWVLLDPTNMSSSAQIGTGDLQDDLFSIYEDLKQALIVFDTPDASAKENAVWKFKFDFDFHWSEHCIEALSAIHHYLAKNKEENT